MTFPDSSLNRSATRMNKRCSHLKERTKEKAVGEERGAGPSAPGASKLVSDFWQMALSTFLLLKAEGGKVPCGVSVPAM